MSEGKEQRSWRPWVLAAGWWNPWPAFQRAAELALALALALPAAEHGHGCDSSSVRDSPRATLGHHWNPPEFKKNKQRRVERRPKKIFKGGKKFEKKYKGKRTTIIRGWSTRCRTLQSIVLFLCFFRELKGQATQILSTWLWSPGWFQGLHQGQWEGSGSATHEGNKISPYWYSPRFGHTHFISKCSWGFHPKALCFYLSRNDSKYNIFGCRSAVGWCVAVSGSLVLCQCPGAEHGEWAEAAGRALSRLQAPCPGNSRLLVELNLELWPWLPPGAVGVHPLLSALLQGWLGSCLSVLTFPGTAAQDPAEPGFIYVWVGADDKAEWWSCLASGSLNQQSGL